MLERGLSVHEIALCRWRAWARYSAGWVSLQDLVCTQVDGGTVRCHLADWTTFASKLRLLCATGPAGAKSCCSQC